MTAAIPLLHKLPIQEDLRVTSFTLSVLIPVYNERHVVEASLRRVLALESELINSLEVIVVDDCSSDGTWDILKRLAEADERLTLLRHERNQGKGAAIRTAIAAANGDISVVHDADLEYNPADIPALLVPFADEGADAVFGSRYLSAQYRRALMHRHTMINRVLTFISNWFTDLSLTDLETCYKAINTTLLKSIPLRSNDFRFEVEIAFKLAKRRARVFEVPVRYLPRTREEGKKIRASDGLLALIAMIRYWLIDDLFNEDEYGSRLFWELERSRRLNLWLARALRPYVGERVIEIGAGIGSLTNQFIPRDLYVASDFNPHYLRYLRAYSFGKPYLRILNIDPEITNDFSGLEDQFDTALAVNVLEHSVDPAETLCSISRTLEPGGKVVVVVPQHKGLFGTLDVALGRRRRFQSDELVDLLRRSGFTIETIFDFNKISVPAWWLNGKLLRRRKFSRIQLKVLDMLAPFLSRIDKLLPHGLSLVAVGVKGSQEEGL